MGKRTHIIYYGTRKEVTTGTSCSGVAFARAGKVVATITFPVALSKCP